MQVFDAHCDLLWRCEEEGKNLFLLNPTGHWDLKRAGRFSAFAQFFAIFADSQGKTGAELKERVQNQYRYFSDAMIIYSDAICACQTKARAQAANREGKVAAFLSVEGAEILGCSIEGLTAAHQMGVRAINLTWNRANAISGSVVEENDRGLSDLGQAFVRHMERLGILVDVSHLSDPGFWDVMEISQKPVIASHSNSRAICPHPRNLTDQQFIAIMKTGGVAGLNFYNPFLGERPNLETITAHIDHFLTLGGENHIAIGGDWDGCDELPKGLREGIGGLHKLYEHLLRKNFREDLLHKIFCQNLMRVVGEVCIT